MLRASSQSFEVREGALASVSPLAGITTTDPPHACGGGVSSSGRTERTERTERTPRAVSRPALRLEASAAAAAEEAEEEEEEALAPAPLASVASTSDDRCFFEVPLVEVNVAGELPHASLLRACYRVVDKHSFLDWGLTSDYDAGVTQKDLRAQGGG